MNVLDRIRSIFHRALAVRPGEKPPEVLRAEEKREAAEASEELIAKQETRNGFRRSGRLRRSGKAKCRCEEDSTTMVGVRPEEKLRWCKVHRCYFGLESENIDREPTLKHRKGGRVRYA